MTKAVFGPFAVLAWRRSQAAADGTCPACGKPVSARDPVIRDDNDADVHPACAAAIMGGA